MTDTGRVPSLGMQLRPSLLVVLLLACGGESAPTSAPTPSPEPTPEPAAEPTPTPEPVPSATDVVPTDDLPAPPPPSEAEAAILAAGSRTFGVSLFRAMARPPEESVAIAPGSILAALGMTAAGARGATATEIWSGLGIAALGDRAPAAVGGLLGALSGDELAIANRLYAANDLAIETPFQDLTRDLFRAPIERVSFGEPARLAINGWVDERTAHRIPEILPSGSVDSTTVMVLVNAMYFLAAWEERFEPTSTVDDFFAAPAGRVTCRMMRRTGRIAIAPGDDVSVVTLPYAGGRFAASFILPAESTTLAAFESTLDGDRLAALLSSPVERAEVSIEIPRFRVEAAAPTSLRSALEALGVRAMFDAGAADFTGIAPRDPRPIYASDVFHRVFVETTERGTEAAAATAVAMVRGGRAPSPEMLRFRADRPFLFVITERPTGVVLFFARVATPGSPSAD